jgi:SAM-dependent methyltransferase
MGPYSEVAEYYDAVVKKYPGYYDSVLFLNNLLAGKKVLEVGVGTGTVARMLSEQGFDVTGIDSSEEMLKIAKSKLSGLDICLKQQDLLNLDLDKKFDSIVFYQGPLCIIRTVSGLVMETYLEDNLQVATSLNKLNHHLKNSGNLVIGIRDDRVPDRSILFGDGLSYHVCLRRRSSDRQEITHMIVDGMSVLAKDSLTKYQLPLSEFHTLLKQNCFSIKGFDLTKNFYIAEK